MGDGQIFIKISAPLILKGVGNEMNGGWWVYTNDRFINGTAALEVFFHFDRLVSL